MNKDAGGTPNPLNPNPAPEDSSLDANPSDAMEDFDIEKEIGTKAAGNDVVVKPVVTSGPTKPTARRTSRPTPMSVDGMSMRNRPVENAPAESVPTGSVPVDPLAAAAAGIAGPAEPPVVTAAGASAPINPDPMARPMEQAPSVATVPAPKKKKKTGWIVGGIIALVIAIGCGAAAAYLLLNQSDPVAKAMEKLFSQGMPEDVGLSGTITLAPNGENSSAVSSIEVGVNSDLATKSLINKSSVTLTANLQDGNSLSAEADEIYAANGDLYIRIAGLVNLIEDYTTLTQSYTGDVDTTNCVDDGSGMTNCVTAEPTVTDCDAEDEADCLQTVEASGSMSTMAMFGDFAGIAEMIDGEWLRISGDDFEMLDTELGGGKMTSCLASFATGVETNSDVIAEAYKGNAFISSTKDNGTIISKGNDVYKIEIDGEKLANYANSMNNTALMSNLYSCLGTQTQSVSADEVEDMMAMVSAIYVEVDADYNFTRLYISLDSEDGASNVTADFSMSYPDSINVAEPSNYRDLSVVLQEIFSQMYGASAEEVVDYEEVLVEE